MNVLEAAISTDPALNWRPRDVSDAQRRDVRTLLTGLAAFVAELGVRDDVDPGQQYAALVVLELDALAVHAPKGVSLLGAALVREEMLAPHDEPGQAEFRAAVTLEWLRARLCSGAVN